MLAYFTTDLVVSAAAASAASLPRSQSASITPHDMYSSSVGALGCKLDTNRVATGRALLTAMTSVLESHTRVEA